MDAPVTLEEIQQLRRNKKDAEAEQKKKEYDVWLKEERWKSRLEYIQERRDSAAAAREEKAAAGKCTANIHCPEPIFKWKLCENHYLREQHKVDQRGKKQGFIQTQ